MKRYLTGQEALELMLVHEYGETNNLIQAANRPPCIRLEDLFSDSISESGKRDCAWCAVTRKRVLNGLWQKLEASKKKKAAKAAPVQMWILD